MGQHDRAVGDEDISKNEQTLVGNMIKPHHSGNRENNMHTQWNGASTETRGRVQVQSKLEKLRQQSEKKKKKRNCGQRKGRPLLGSKKHVIKLNVRERMHREK